jgi:hypothetical protein
VQARAAQRYSRPSSSWRRGQVPAQLKAAEVILDRGWGKGPQHVGGSEGGEPIQIYLKNFVLPEGDKPPEGDGGWQASDEPAVRIR